MNPCIGLFALAGQYEVGFAETANLLQKVYQKLTEQFRVELAPQVIYDDTTLRNAVHTLSGKPMDVLLICVGTWSEDQHVLNLLSYFDKPVILWAFPGIETGSLCGVQQICCLLKELSKTYFYVYGEADNGAVFKEIGEIARAIALRHQLQFAKIATFGGRLKGMSDVIYDELEVKDKTGVQIVNLDEEELQQAVHESDSCQAREIWHGLQGKVGGITADETAGIEAAQYYLAMKGLVKTYDLAGFCVKCYPRLMGKVCLGYSLLAEEGIVCGCEGDINGSVAMKILFDLTGQPIHNTDLLYPDPLLNTILFSHCGSGGFSLAADSADIHLAPVRLAHRGVCCLFSGKPGKVTLINLVGRRGTFRLSVMEGEALECGMEFPGNPLKVHFNADIDAMNRQIACEGIGHHWMAGYGDVGRELEIFCQLNKIRLIKLS